MSSINRTSPDKPTGHDTGRFVRPANAQARLRIRTVFPLHPHKESFRPKPGHRYMYGIVNVKYTFDIKFPI